MERTALFYMANLGSETQRAFALKESGRTDEARAAYARAMDIIKSAEKLAEGEGPAEINMLKEYIKAQFETKNHLPYINIKQELRAYFEPYTLRLLSTQ